MKVCFFNSDFPPKIGGIATFNWGLAYYLSLSEKIKHVQVVAFKHRQPSREDSSQKLSIIRLPWFGFLSLVKEIAKYIYRFRSYDVFHATNLFPVGFLVVLLGRFFFRKPVFLTFHGTDVVSLQASWKTKWAKKFALRYASRAIAVSFSTLKQAVDYCGVSPEKFRVIYYSLGQKDIQDRIIQRKRIRIQYQLSENDFVVLTVAHLVKRKGIDDLIQAISLISESEVKLMVVGQGPEENNLKELVQNLKISSRVIFTGLVDKTEPFYAASDVFSLPSVFIKEEGDIEGLGIVLLEAQQYGLPVIGTNSGGIPEAIDNNGSGFVVPERSPETIKEKILLLFNNQELYRQMSQWAPQFVKEKFDWSNSINQYLLLYVQSASKQ